MVLHTLVDYALLKEIWWFLLGVLLIGFAITDGFDMGVAALLPFVAKTDGERRVAINTVGPVWEGNQVWLITGGGAIFAAWPQLYAVSFSGFYLAMFLVLAALILRPVGFKYRSKRESPRWRNNWDWALFIGGFVPALIFGVAVGNVLQGVPFKFDSDLRMAYEGNLFGLLNPYALLVGLLSLSMLVMHGAAWLGVKADGIVADRGRRYGSYAALAVIVLFAVDGLLLWAFVPGYVIKGTINPEGVANPLAKEAARQAGAWFANYGAHPWLLIAPAIGFLGALGAFAGLRAKASGWSFVASSLSVFGIIGTVGVSMFPFILPSSIDPASSLTVWDSSSSHATLFNMLVAAVIFVPIVLIYTSWVYKVLWGRVTEEEVTSGDTHAY